jgi:hypothetical protein
MKNTWPILVFISLLFFNGSATASISGEWKLAPVGGPHGYQVTLHVRKLVKWLLTNLQCLRQLFA